MRRERSITPSRKEMLNAVQARARVNRFLLSQIGSQFCSGDPELDVVSEQWCVPILFVTPGFVAGQVGRATISSNSGELQEYTDPEEMYLSADELRKRHHAAIKAAFLRTREG